MGIIRDLSSLTEHHAYFVLFTPASFHWSTLPLVTRMSGQGLQRTQESHQRLIFTPVFGRSLFFDLTFRERFGLHFQVDLSVDVRGL